MAQRSTIHQKYIVNDQRAVRPGPNDNAVAILRAYATSSAGADTVLVTAVIYQRKNGSERMCVVKLHGTGRTITMRSAWTSMSYPIHSAYYLLREAGGDLFSHLEPKLASPGKVSDLMMVLGSHVITNRSGQYRPDALIRYEVIDLDDFKA